MINADKRPRWEADIGQSVELYNTWYLKFAPEAFGGERADAAALVEHALKVTEGLNNLTTDVLKDHSAIFSTLRMCTCPPIARDRLSGLAGVSPDFVGTLEGGTTTPRMKPEQVIAGLGKLLAVLRTLIDYELFSWVRAGKKPDPVELHRAATIIADRSCAAAAGPFIRNAQEERQLAKIREHLTGKGYLEKRPMGSPEEMEPGTFAFRVNIQIPRLRDENRVQKIPVDAIIQPMKPQPGKLPIMIEAKSAGDFTNTNKRQKEEGRKGDQLREHFGDRLTYILFLCGYSGELISSTRPMLTLIGYGSIGSPTWTDWGYDG
jgi:hypothetical protein